MKKASTVLPIIFLIVGALTVCEFIFVRGMFTWIIMCGLVIVFGAINAVVEVSQKHIVPALNYVLATVALCMGYMTLL